MPEYTAFKLPGKINDSQLTDQMQSNLVAFVDWCLLGINAFYTVRLGDVSPFGGSPSTLRLSDDNRYSKGTAWDSYKNNWVWESQTEADVQPVQISGIYLNNNFLPIGTTGTYSYNISYPLGRVIFNAAIPTNSVVQVEYSYKQYSVYPASVNWFKQLTRQTFRRDDSQFDLYGSGIWSTFPDSRTQLPAIVIEPVPRRTWVGKGLGGGQWIYTDVLFHIFAESSFDRDNILDILTYQNEKRIFFFDKNTMSRNGIFPLNQFGYLQNPSSVYPWLLNNYLWRTAIIRNTTSQQLDDDPESIYKGNCRWTLEVDFPEL